MWMMLRLKELWEIFSHFSLQNTVPSEKRWSKQNNKKKTVIFLPTPTTARLCLKLCWWNMFFFMFCFHMRWHDLCLSLWAFVTVVFFSDTELSVLCCDLIPIIRFVLLCVSEMKRLVVTMKACNQHEVC